MIDQRLIAYALEAVDTTNFERFSQTFYGAIQDREFVPLGGTHDGGAEGYDAFGPELATDETATVFLQVSKQVSTTQKIRATVKRLRDYGRLPKVLLVAARHKNRSDRLQPSRWRYQEGPYAQRSQADQDTRGGPCAARSQAEPAVIGQS